MSAEFEQLSCQELVELVTDYLEDGLSADERARFDAHVGLCDGCNVYLEQMRQTIRLTGTLPADALAPEAERDLLEAFRGWRSAEAQ
jgi:anti-sigma factor RsiW